MQGCGPQGPGMPSPCLDGTIDSKIINLLNDLNVSCFVNYMNIHFSKSFYNENKFDVDNFLYQAETHVLKSTFYKQTFSVKYSDLQQQWFLKAEDKLSSSSSEPWLVCSKYKKTSLTSEGVRIDLDSLVSTYRYIRSVNRFLQDFVYKDLKHRSTCRRWIWVDRDWLIPDQFLLWFPTKVQNIQVTWRL